MDGANNIVTTMSPAAAQLAAEASLLLAESGEPDKPEVFSNLTFKFDDELGILYATLTHSPTKQAVSEESINAYLQKNGYQSLYKKPDILKKILTAVSEVMEGSYEFAQRLDAKASIKISEDHTQGFITTQSAFGGKELEYLDILTKMQEAEIDPRFYGGTVIADILKASPVNNKLFAQAVQPVSGTHAKFHFLVEETVSRKSTVDKQGNKIFSNLIEFVIVEAGAPLLRLVPSTPGKDGYDVLGEPLPATPGKELSFNATHVGSVVSADDPNLLVAEIKGHPIIYRTTVKVDPVLHIEDVTFKTGNINFDGSVNITGDVNSGMEVCATGNINVSGIVEKATIIAGNNIIVGGGVLGKELSKEEKKALESTTVDTESPNVFNFKSFLKAGGAITAKYISMTEVACERDLAVMEYVLHCNVHTNGQILLGQEGGKGCLIGGYSYARAGAAVNYLGNEAYAKTHLSVGYSKQFAEQHRELNEDLQKQTEILEKVTEGKKALEKTITKGFSIANAEQRIQSIDTAINQVQHQIESIKHQLGELSVEIEETEAVRATVKNRAYANVYLGINGVDYRLPVETAAGYFHMLNHKIKHGQ